MAPSASCTAPGQPESIGNWLRALCNAGKPADKFYDANTGSESSTGHGGRSRFRVAGRDNTGADMHTDIRHATEQIAQSGTTEAEAEAAAEVVPQLPSRSL